MVGRPARNLLEAADVAQDLEGLETVGVHHQALAGVEPGRLVEDLVGNAQLAEVVQQAGDFQLLAVGRRHPHALGDPARQAGDAQRMLGGERALRIDDAREDLGQLLQLGMRRAAGPALLQHFLQHGLDAARLQLQPEGFRRRCGEEEFDQPRREIAAGVGGDRVADRCDMHQQPAARVIRRSQRIDAIDQVDQVGPLRRLRRNIRQAGEALPARVVVEHRFGQRGERREIAQQRVADVAVALRRFPVEFADQMAVHRGRRNADVVQHAEIEQEGGFGVGQARLPRAGSGHRADPLAVRDVVDADQIERIGQGIDDLAQVDVEASVRGSRHPDQPFRKCSR